MASRRIRKILIANRGEIAVRVIRTCRELGISSVAVFSDADAAALHVRLADEAYHIGPSPAVESYLVQERILDAAARSGADAIHPGYGFLSENAGFAEACDRAGVIFIGPPAGAMRAMGDKTSARQLMREAQVPMAPGTVDALESAEQAVAIARSIGFPVLIKAAAGGGGKGMRSVYDAGEVERSVRQAQSEAKSAFGDGRVYIEKLLLNPRHIEFQVLADTHGNCVHLFERECSIQRRHQKVVEEAPSSVLTPDLRRDMGTAAVQATQACGYVGAGTVEFLVDRDLNFYFLEMNTRLQVEHPVTEWITGLDLVAEQIRIAEGESLGYTQADLTINGHAIESRVYAEDVEAGFLPDSGRIVRHMPPSGLGVRLDAGVEDGDHISLHYDPMISKLTTWGRSRLEAIDRMDRALSEYNIAGVETTISFCRFVMQHDAFRTGSFSTGFVTDHFDTRDRTPGESHHEAAAIAVSQFLGGASNKEAAIANQLDGARASNWHQRRSYQ